MSHYSWTRPILLAFVLATSWLVVGGSAAHAGRPPDPNPEGVGVPTPPVPAPDATPFWQFVLIAPLACLVAVAATLAVQAILRRSSRAGTAHA